MELDENINPTEELTFTFDADFSGPPHVITTWNKSDITWLVRVI